MKKPEKMSRIEALNNMYELGDSSYIQTVEDIDDLVWVRFIGTRPKSKKMKIISDQIFLFSDYKGSREATEAAAMKWRNAEFVKLLMENKIILESYFRPPPDIIIHDNKNDNAAFTDIQANNKSGKCGVTLSDYSFRQRRVLTNGKVKYYTVNIRQWNAQWIEYVEVNGLIRRKPSSERFSIKLYGFQKAKKLASECRDKAVLEINQPDALARREKYRIDKSIRWKS